MRTHEDNDTFGIFLPAVGELIVLFLCHPMIHNEEWCRGISKLRVMILVLFLLMVRQVVGGIYCTSRRISEDRPRDKQRTRLGTVSLYVNGHITGIRYLRWKDIRAGGHRKRSYHCGLPGRNVSVER
jgi:hypothetical protein